MKYKPIPGRALTDMGLRTQREFRTLKRFRWVAVMRALERYSLGCAFSPAYPELEKIFTLAYVVKRKQSVKEWGK